MEFFIVAWLLTALVFGFLGMWVADQKSRPSSEGFLLGLLFGPLGVLIEAVLPNGVPQAKVAVIPEDPLVRQARLIAWRADQDDRMRRAAEAARQREREQIEQLKQGVAASLGVIVSLATAPIRAYRTIPEWAAPIVWGLLVAVPIVVALIFMRG